MANNNSVKVNNQGKNTSPNNLGKNSSSTSAKSSNSSNSSNSAKSGNSSNSAKSGNSSNSARNGSSNRAQNNILDFNNNSNSRNNGNNSNNNINSNNNNSNILNNLVNNANNKANNKKQKSSSNMIVYIGIAILIIVLIVAGYFIYKHFKKTRVSQVVSKTFIPIIHDASIDKRINYGSIPESSQGNEYNINMWVYVNDYVYRKDEDKCILYKGDVIGALNNGEVENNVNTKCNPSIWLLKNVNTLRVLIGLETKYGAQDCNATSPVCGETVDAETCDIKNFPLQTWVNINISLRSNVLDIFLNGNLHKSCILEGFPIINKGDLYICKDGGYNGYLSKLVYSNKALSTKEIMNKYKNGPTLK